MKVLDQNAFKEAKRLHTGGMAYRHISEALTEAGYRTPGGGPITQPHLSVFMLKNGYRVYYRTKQRSRGTKKTYTKEPMPGNTFTDVADLKFDGIKLLAAIYELPTTDYKKAKIINALME